MIDLLRSIGSLPRACFQKQQTENESSESNEAAYQFAYAYSAFELASIVNASAALNFQMHGTSPGEEIQLSYRQDLSPEDHLIRVDRQAFVQRLVKVLPGKEQSVLQQYYFTSLPYADMEEARAGSTKSWLSRLHHKGLNRLRKTMLANSGLLQSLHDLSSSPW